MFVHPLGLHLPSQLLHATPPTIPVTWDRTRESQSVERTEAHNGDDKVNAQQSAPVVREGGVGGDENAALESFAWTGELRKQNCMALQFAAYRTGKPKFIENKNSCNYHPAPHINDKAVQMEL